MSGNDCFKLILTSFFTAQMKDLDKKQKYEQFLKKNIMFLIDKMEKLYKERDDIIKELNEVLEELDKLD